MRFSWSTRQPVVYRAAVRRSAERWLSQRIASLISTFRVRKTVRELSLLSDEELRDIGLLRADIADAATAASKLTAPTDGRAKNAVSSNADSSCKAAAPPFRETIVESRLSRVP